VAGQQQQRSRRRRHWLGRKPSGGSAKAQASITAAVPARRAIEPSSVRRSLRVRPMREQHQVQTRTEGHEQRADGAREDRTEVGELLGGDEAR
jgi:hypothetical protein